MNQENLIEDSQVPPKIPIFLNRNTNSIPKSVPASGINASIASSSIRLETTEEESVRLSRAVSVQEHTPFKSAVPDNSAVPKVYQYTATSKYCSPYKVNTGTDRFDQIHKFKNIVTRSNIFKQEVPAPTPPNTTDGACSESSKKEQNPFLNWYRDEQAYISGDKLKNQKVPLGLYTISNSALTATIGQCNQILEFRKRHLDRVERIPVQPTLLQFESSDVQTPSSRSTKTYPTPKWISPNYKLSNTGTAEDPSSEERTLATSELNTNEQQAAKEFKKINRADSTPSTAGSDTWAEEVNRLLKIPLSPKFSKSKDISNSKESDRVFNIPKELFNLC